MEEKLTLNEQLAKDIAENRESWIERVNTCLETLFDKTKNDIKIQRKMAKYYAWRNQVARSKLKVAHEKIDKLTKQAERRLDMLSKASLHASNLL